MGPITGLHVYTHVNVDELAVMRCSASRLEACDLNSSCIYAIVCLTLVFLRSQSDGHRTEDVRWTTAAEDAETNNKDGIISIAFRFLSPL